jgi:non-specific serine/threonine protein kinase
VAVELMAAYSEGVRLIELAPLSDPALLPQAVASALGLREDTVRPTLATLTDFLSTRSLLLILDNCEHVLEACAQLAEALLRACPNVCILASSREALGVAGEAPFRVPSLRAPDIRRLPPIETLAHYEAVRLFVERAAAVLPGFTLTDDNAPAVAQVCARLDGIPLAIELAAARVNVLRVEQIAARLEKSFELLRGGSPAKALRHQTLQNLLDWSYSLLPEKEKTLLRFLSVFRGSFTLEAAEAVGGDSQPESLLEPGEVLEALLQLVNKSLVVAEHSPDHQAARYRLLETVRQYGWAKLEYQAETGVARQRHSGYYLGWVASLNPRVLPGKMATWLKLVETELDNLRLALSWVFEDETAAGLEPEERVKIAGLVVRIWRFWFLQGYFAEGQGWVEAALQLNRQLEPDLEVRQQRVDLL